MSNRDVSALETPLYLGNGNNRTVVETTGELKFEGNATIWDDTPNSLIGQRLFSNIGTIDYDYDEACLVASANGDINSNSDTVILSFQVSHSAKNEGDLMLHVHWEQEDATEREFTYQYRVQANGQPKTTTWTGPTSVTSTVGNIFTYESGVLNQITDLGTLDTTGKGLSAIVQIRFTRSDSNAGTINITSVDAHYEKDTVGSREEFTK